MEKNDRLTNRRNFIRLTGLGIGAGILGLNQAACNSGRKTTEQPDIQGFEDTGTETSAKVWEPVSDRKVRLGIVGYGRSRFGASFGLQNHPNVEVVAASDLIPERRAELAEVVGAKKTYPSLEELVKDDNIEAVFVATDAPGHARHAIEVLKHGKHVAVAVPAVFGSLEEADELFEAVKRSGLKYMMFETSMYRANLWAMRQLYKSGALGKLVYAEGEYWHYSEHGIDSFKGWRHGLPPMWYPTHDHAYYVGVTDGSFLKGSCLGMPGEMERYRNNKYNNPFATQIAFYRTSDGGMARMGRSSDTRGHGYGSETGRVRGTRGSYYDQYQGVEENLPDLERPPLPPGVPAGGHGGSHGRLGDEFIMSILQDRKPLVDIAMSLNMTVPGVIAHQSALKDGEWLDIPQYKL